MKIKKSMFAFILALISTFTLAACNSKMTPYTDTDKEKFEESLVEVLPEEMAQAILVALEGAEIPSKSLEGIGEWIKNIGNANPEDPLSSLEMVDDLWAIDGVSTNKASKFVYLFLVETLAKEKATDENIKIVYDELVKLGINDFSEALTIILDVQVNTRKFYTDAKIEQVQELIEKLAENPAAADVKTLINTQVQALENGVGKISLKQWKTVTKSVETFIMIFTSMSGAEFDTDLVEPVLDDLADLAHRYVKAQIAILKGISDAMINEAINDTSLIINEDGVFTEKGAILIAKAINPAFQSGNLDKSFLEGIYNKTELKDEVAFTEIGNMISLCDKVAKGTATSAEKLEFTDFVNSIYNNPTY